MQDECTVTASAYKYIRILFQPVQLSKWREYLRQAYANPYTFNKFGCLDGASRTKFLNVSVIEDLNR